MAINIILVVMLLLISGLSYVCVQLYDNIRILEARQDHAATDYADLLKKVEHAEKYTASMEKKFTEATKTLSAIGGNISDINRKTYGTADVSEFKRMQTVVMAMKEQMKVVVQWMKNSTIRGSIEYQDGLVGVHIAKETPKETPKETGGEKE